jgi:WD40 repeat protein/Flp pilus assembly protein TadD
VKLWESGTGQELLTLSGPLDPITSLAFSRDGEYLISGSGDLDKPGEITLWDARSSRQKVLTLRGHTELVISLAFSPDGQQLASGSWDRTVKVWNALSGQEQLTLRGHTETVTAVAFSRDGQRLATASGEQGKRGEIKLWDPRTGQELLTIGGHTDVITALEFSPDGQQLVSGSWDKTVKVWDAQHGRDLDTFKGHPAGVVSVLFSPDGNRLQSRDAQGTLMAWDVKNGEQAPAPLASVPFLGGPAAWHPTRPILALVHGDRIQLIDTQPPDALELGYREWKARLDIPWQREQARQHEERENWFAAAFHWGQLAHHAPASPEPWLHLEDACRHLGDWQPALAVCDRLLHQDPTLAPVYFRRARLRANLFQFHEAAADELAGLALVGGNPVGWPEMAAGAAAAGHEFANRGDWRLAQHAFRAAALWERQGPLHRHWLAWSQLVTGEHDAFRATCREFYERYRTTADVDTTYRLTAELAASLTPGPSLWRGLGKPVAEAILGDIQRSRNSIIVYTACIIPDHGLPAEELVRLAQGNVTADRAWYLLDDLGAAQYRAGQFAAAIATLEEAVKRHGQGGTNWMKLFLAMACHKQGRVEQGRRWFDQAVFPQNPDWRERFLFQCLQQEAAQLLGLSLK